MEVAARGVLRPLLAMTEWTQRAHVLADHAVSGVLGHVSSLHFDTMSELLWVGSASGQLTSHTGALPTLPRYTSLAAHGVPKQPRHVRGILSDDKFIISLSEGRVCASQRQGLGRWSMQIEDHAPGVALAGLCASPQSASSDIIVGGAAPNSHDALFALHSISGRVVRRAVSDGTVTQLRKGSRYLCVGTEQGTIQLHDPRSLHAEHKLPAHHGGLIDLQTDGHLIYSIGWTLRQGRRIPEPFIKTHDVRTMQALIPTPLTAPGGPALLAIHPKKSSIVAVATPQSQFQLVDIHQPGQSQFYSMPSAALITALAFSSSAEALAFGESDGSVRVWTSDAHANTLRINAYPTPPVSMPDYAPPPPVMEWTDDTPLSCIGMPHYDKPLLSRINYDALWSDASPLFSIRAPVRPDALEHAQHIQGLTYAPLPRHLRGTRNRLVPSDPVLARLDRHGKLTPAARMRLRQTQHGAVRRIPPPLSARHTEPMPDYYGHLSIPYSRFGVEDFDFASYNQTRYAGLETNIGAAYANSYFQALHYTQPFRAFAKQHTIMPCADDDCLLCEAGFLFRMLEDAHGTHCQATQLLRVLTRSPQAALLGLLDESNAPYSHMAQTLNHFFLECASQHALRTSTSAALDRAFLPLCVNPCAWSLLQYSTCHACGHTTARSQLAHVVDLLYPTGAAPHTYDFATLLSASMLRETFFKSTCRQCYTRFAPHNTWRSAASTHALPAVLCVNTCIDGAEQFHHWEPTDHGFVPLRLAMDVEHGYVHAQSLWDASAPWPRAGTACYMLRAMVIQAQGARDAPHLCALVRAPNDDDAPDAWYVFNDFLVRPITEAEALRFGEPWKVPALLVWERVDAVAESHAKHLADLARHLRPDLSLLLQDTHISQHRRDDLCRHRILSESELPKPGTLVAIDAEFVSLAQEELEVFSDGTRTLIQPSSLALARVSVLRGEGPREGEPFIDDHIWTTEPIVDYLTQFSGIQPDDLDPKRTQRTLVSHKTAYKKLRMLTDLGCRFIGHGLAKDFRIINIFVPPSQVIDTVQLYHSPAHPRNLSLRFLSWFLLKKDIQQGLALGVEQHDGHDSIEDALAALQLFRKYEQFERDGRLEDMLEDLYEIGPRVNWRPPEKIAS